MKRSSKQGGASLVEYALLVAVVAVTLIPAISYMAKGSEENLALCANVDAAVPTPDPTDKCWKSPQGCGLGGGGKTMTTCPLGTYKESK